MKALETLAVSYLQVAQGPALLVLAACRLAFRGPVLMIGMLTAAQKRRRDLARLAAMDDRTLRDIGLTRADVGHASTPGPLVLW
jgi:uncharacterized protein YjiS (DUF1127 family)